MIVYQYMKIKNSLPAKHKHNHEKLTNIKRQMQPKLVPVLSSSSSSLSGAGTSCGPVLTSQRFHGAHVISGPVAHSTVITE